MTEEIASEAVAFEGGLGTRLAGRVDQPRSGSVHAWVVLAHCFTCGKDFVATRRIGRALAARGFGVLRFDFTGIGESEGDFGDTSFTSNIDDLCAAAGWLRTHREAPSMLVGHSLGGAAVLAAAARIPELCAVATMAAPSEPGHVRERFGSAIDEISQHGSAEIDFGGRELTIGRGFIDDVENWDLAADIRRMQSALLVFHSPLDSLVSIDHARHIFEAARHPKSFVSLHDAEHMLTTQGDADYVAAVLGAWITRYFEHERGG